MTMNAPMYLYASERERQKRRDDAMDALARAKRFADYDDWEIWDECKDTEVSLQTFVDVEWESNDDPRYPGRVFRDATAHVIGAQLGNILLTRETLDAAFPGQVDRLEERLSEEFTAAGEA
jgi:hypothetical protein